MLSEQEIEELKGLGDRAANASFTAAPIVRDLGAAILSLISALEEARKALGKIAGGWVDGADENDDMPDDEFAVLLQRIASDALPASGNHNPTKD